MATHTLNSSISVGITLTTGGTDRSPFTITTHGTINTTGNYGVYSTISSPSLLNEGVIDSGKFGVLFFDGGTVDNSGTAALIQGEGTGIYFGGASGRVINQGTIVGVGGYGVLLNEGGSVTNTGVGSFIEGYRYGVEVLSQSGTIVNEGSIEGIDGVMLRFGGYVDNRGTSSQISSFYTGIFGTDGRVTVVNDGTITGVHQDGVYLYGGGYVQNSGRSSFIQGNDYGVKIHYGTVVNSGTISGGRSGFGVYLYEGGTVTNSGTIYGGEAAVVFEDRGGADADNDRLIVDAGAVFDGAVIATSNPNDTTTLELAAGKAGRLGGTIGQDFVGFSTIAFDADSTWSIVGDVAGLADGQEISGFTVHDTIELAGVAFTRTGGAFGAAGEDTYTVATAGTLTIDADGTDYQLLIAGARVGQHDFVLGGDDLTITEVICYVAGTRIATSVGEIAVEELMIGDLVETRDAGLRPVKWIGRRAYDGRFIAGNRDALPVCIKRGALGEGVPARDLWVSPGHAVCVEGALVHAFRLINGVSVVQAEAVERVAYYHVELDSHEVIYAENCPAESFFDEDFRTQFQNAAEFAAMYPAAAAGRRCLPRLEDGFVLEAIRQRVNARAGIAVA